MCCRTRRPIRVIPFFKRSSSVCYQGLITLEEGTITEGLIWFRVESYHVVISSDEDQQAAQSIARQLRAGRQVA